MWPTAEAITAITSPWARAIAVRLPPWVAMIEPAPTKTSANVPTNSAKPRCSGAVRTTKNPRTRGGRRHFEGCRPRCLEPTPSVGVSTAERKAAHVCGHPQAQAPELPGCGTERAHHRLELRLAAKARLAGPRADGVASRRPCRKRTQ